MNIDNHVCGDAKFIGGVK